MTPPVDPGPPGAPTGPADALRAARLVGVAARCDGAGALRQVAVVVERAGVGAVLALPLVVTDPGLDAALRDVLQASLDAATADGRTPDAARVAGRLRTAATTVLLVSRPAAVAQRSSSRTI